MSHSKRSSKGAGPSQALHIDSDEEDTLSQTQTPRQPRRTLERRTQNQVELKAYELVQFLLLKDQKKIPIKRADILKHVVKDYKDVFPAILKHASGILQMVFGMELVEIDLKNHTYVLINKLPLLEGKSLEDEDLICKMGLLLAILSLIFMKGNVAKESAVWEFLKRLGIDSSRGKCRAFGDVKKVVTEEFVKQKYLEYIRLPHTDPPEFEFRWGPRAAKETSKSLVLQFVAKVQKRNPKSWMSQYKEAEEESSAAGGK